MNNFFKGRGNLGQLPELKYIDSNDGKRAVLNLSVRFDRDKRQDDGSYIDNGGFWMDVSIFGKLAEQAAKILSKGARVYVEGSPKQEHWEKEGEAMSKLKLEASYIALDLWCIEEVQYRKKSETTGTNQAAVDEAVTA